MTQNNENMKSGYSIINILLIESSFSRISNVSFEEKKLENKLNVSADFDIVDDEIYVSETLTFEQYFENVLQVSANIKYVGVFKKVGEPSVDMETFGKVNGAAIIYPYVREHLSSLTLKAGLNNLLIPPMNFSAPKTEK